MISVTRLRLCIITRWPGRQYELAQRCAIDPGWLCRYATGIEPMQNHHRAALAHVLGVEPTDLDGWWDGSELWERASTCP